MSFDLDPVVIAALIALVGVIVGIGGYAVQNLYITRRNREAREYQIKRERYENLIKNIARGVHIVLTKGEKTSLQDKQTWTEVMNVLWLYASDDVMRTLNRYISSGDLNELQKLIIAMRKDLIIKTDLKPPEIKFFRAT